MSSHRQILKSSAIIGGSSVIAILLGIVKVKVLAILLGAAGVGLMGLFQNIMWVGATVAGCGLATSGVRQLAAAQGEQATLDSVRHALWRGNFFLGLIGGAALWFARVPVTQWVFKNAAYASEVGLLGVGVWLTLIAGSQMALLQGMRRIGDLARVQIFGSLVGAVAGIGLASWLQIGGILWFVLTAPLATALAGAWYAAKLPRPIGKPDRTATRNQLRAMLLLGVPFMITALMTLGTQFLARTMVTRELGLEGAGHFQAAWAISMQYTGFVLGAMATDYYPRLSATIHDPAAARKLVSEQTEMALLLAIPALLIILATAHWAIYILYSSGFDPAISLLRWQTLGTIFKVASWPMGFILLAQQRGGWFIFIEVLWDVTYLSILYFGLSQWGLDASGFGFTIAYLLIFLVLFPISNQAISFRFSKKWIIRLALLTLFSITIVFLSYISNGVTFGIVIFPIVFISFLCFKEINYLVNITGWISKRIYKSKV